MIWQPAPVVAPGKAQLAIHGLRVHADAHGGNLHSAVEKIVPEKDITVERPVVIVRSAAVVLPSGFQGPADAHDKGRTVLLQPDILALSRAEIGVAVFQLLGCDKGDVALQLAQDLKLGVNGLNRILGVADSRHDIHDGELQIVQIAVFRQDNLFPVPLVDIDGMKIVEFVLVAADRVHIGIKALAGEKSVALERQTLPLGKRLHHLGFVIGAQDLKADRALDTVQVVVQARVFLDKQRGGNPVKVQKRTQPVFKQTVDQADRLLGVIHAEKALIPLGNDRVHSGTPFLIRRVFP